MSEPEHIVRCEGELNFPKVSKMRKKMRAANRRLLYFMGLLRSLRSLAMMMYYFPFSSKLLILKWCSGEDIQFTYA